MKVIITLLICLPFVQPVLAQVDLDNGLVAFYPFTGNADDASGNNHHGQVQNGISLTADRFGNANSAFLFDGADDYIRVLDNGAFSTPAFTLSIWFQSHSDKLQNLVAKRDFSTTAGSGGAQYQFFINYPPFPGIGSNLIGVNSTCYDITGSSYLNTTGWICTGAWHHAVVTFDGQRHKIYIDGMLKKDEATGFAAMLNCKSELRFGNWHQADLIPFMGRMDDIRWYNRAVNSQEVAALFGGYSAVESLVDFSFSQDMCYPHSVTFRKAEAQKEHPRLVKAFSWDFGDGRVSNRDPATNWYDKFGTYTVKLRLEYQGGCLDSVVKTIDIKKEQGNLLVNDTSVCADSWFWTQLPLNTLNFCLRDQSGVIVSNSAIYGFADTTKTYFFTANRKGKNLVVNGDFEAGVTGFTSGYTLNTASGVMPGTYTVAAKEPAWNPSFLPCNDLHFLSTNMLLVNGGDVMQKIVWSQNVAVEPNTNYGFAALCQTLSAGEPANLRYLVNGLPISDWFNLNAEPCTEHRPSATWNSGNRRTVRIEIENMTRSTGGNDFSIDDIFFGPVFTETDSFKVTVFNRQPLEITKDTTICAGESVQLNAKASGGISYRWSPATDLSDPASANPVANPRATTRYRVTVTAGNGCDAIDSVLVTVKAPQQCNTTTVAASFTLPDTVCVNTPVNITNTSTGASSYYWNFCVADLNKAPAGENLGNIGNQLSLPVFMDYVQYQNNYYGFLINYNPGKLVRLDFGNSLLNTPTSVDLGNFGGIIPAGAGAEGIQLVFNEGKWYAIVVGGHNLSTMSPRILKIDFGADLTNLNPVATNWGNIGNLSTPIDLHVFKEGANWYGLTVNAENNTITRFNFTNSFNNIPTAVNIGNIGSLAYPTGIYAIKDNSNWRVFVVNGGNNTRQSGTFSLTRLDFGSSLLNTPTGLNLGNPGNMLQHPRDLTILRQCGQIVGFAVNGHLNNSSLVKLDFGNDLSSTTPFSSLGVVGNSSFPHSISKLFRVNDDVYGFITNVDNNTVTRLKFSGCTTASAASSQKKDPEPVTYNSPGVYNINLTVDDGLPTQNTTCRQVFVVPSTHTPLQKLMMCSGDSVLLTSSNATANEWSNGSTANAVYARTAGLYWVRSLSAGGCINIDSFQVSVSPLPVVNLGRDTSFCTNTSLQLDAGNAGATFLWQNGQTGQTLNANTQGLYHVAVTKDGCTAKDSILLTALPLPGIQVSDDQTICREQQATLSASGGTSYQWVPATGLTNPSSASTLVSPQATTKYYVTVTGQNRCQNKDSVVVTVNSKPVFAAFSSKPVLCVGDTVVLSATGGDTYLWSPAASLGTPNSSFTTAFPATTIRYKVSISDNECAFSDSLFITLPVADKPSVLATKTNDIDCFIGQATLQTGGGSRYLWQPSTGLSDPTSSRPVARINTTTTYHVTVITNEGCIVEDSLTVYVNKGSDGAGFPVASAFSPNNDGRNDCFGVKHWGSVDNFSMSLFNRWGERVFQANDSEKCWNGWYKGELQPAEVYVYIIKAKTICGDVVRKGTFTLIK